MNLEQATEWFKVHCFNFGGFRDWVLRQCAEKSERSTIKWLQEMHRQFLHAVDLEIACQISREWSQRDSGPEMFGEHVRQIRIASKRLAQTAAVASRMRTVEDETYACAWCRDTLVVICEPGPKNMARLMAETGKTEDGVAAAHSRSIRCTMCERGREFANGEPESKKPLLPFDPSRMRIHREWKLPNYDYEGSTAAMEADSLQAWPRICNFPEAF